MAAEDEAVQLAFRTGTAAVQSASEIIKYLLEGLAQARRARAAGNRNDRIPARFARALTHGAANAIDGHGEKGIVSAETVRAQNPDQYREAMVFPGAVADNREDIQKLKRELMNHGVKFSVFDTVNPMDGSPAVSIGIQGRDMDIMTQALVNIGVESFGMDRKELEECARGIERDGQNRYPRAFKRNGISWEFERTGDGRNSWVGSAGGHSREQYRVTLDPDNENKASFECTREGAAFAAAPGMVLEAAIDRGCFISENKKKIDPKQAAAAEKNAALLSEALGNSRAASPESPVGQTKAAKKIAESKMQPSMPARNEGMHR